jgi:hypothetical protein
MFSLWSSSSSLALQLIKSLVPLQKFPQLFMAVAHQFLNPSILESFPTSYLHLARGLPTFLSPSGCTYISLLGIQFSSILATLPAHRSLEILITTERLGSLKRSQSSLLNLHLHWSLSLIGPYILRRIFLSNTSTIFSFVRDNVQHSAPYNTIGHTDVLYNKIFVVLDIKLHLKCFWRLK